MSRESRHPRTPAVRFSTPWSVAPSQIEALDGTPQIVDFRRHIQPILDQHCVKCHGESDPDGGICLSGTRGIPSHGAGRVLSSYVELVVPLSRGG